MNDKFKINRNDVEQENTDKDDRWNKSSGIDTVTQEDVDPYKTDEIEREKEEQRQSDEQRRRERSNQE